MKLLQILWAATRTEPFSEEVKWYLELKFKFDGDKKADEEEEIIDVEMDWGASDMFAEFWPTNYYHQNRMFLSALSLTEWLSSRIMI